VPILRAVLCGPDGERNRMVFRSVGTNLARMYADSVGRLAEDLGTLENAGPDFVEIWPQNLGVILGGRLDTDRLRAVGEVLLGAELSYTVHAPLEVNLMDLTSHGLQRDVLEASLRFAKGIGAGVVVCHAGQRVGARDARHNLGDQLAAERSALRGAGDLAGDLGITMAVENYYPERPIVRGAVYDYSVWPSRLAEQISAVDHPAVGICLDVGHAALAANFFGFDLIGECGTIASLVRHVHLHDNLQRTNLAGEPPVSEHTVYGLGDLHLPPGQGTIPFEELFRRMDFSDRLTCCVELSPEGFSLVPEALHTARRISLAVATREPVSA
jgi:sugar phosphate isomerase/epimerase